MQINEIKLLQWLSLFNILCTSQGFLLPSDYYLFCICTVPTIFNIHRHSYG